MLIAYPIPAFYRQIDEPADALTGALWFNTSTNILKVLNSSSDWINVAEEQDLVLKLIGQNALNILDLTAQANLTAGINANFIRDIYTDSDGYLNTIDAGNTTAQFLTNKYLNLGYRSLSGINNKIGTIIDENNFFDEEHDTYADSNGGNVESYNSSLGKTFDEKLVEFVKVKLRGEANSNSGSSVSTITMKLQSYDGSMWNDEKTWTYTRNGNSAQLNVNEIYFLNKNVKGLRINMTSSQSAGSSKSSLHRYFEIEESHNDNKLIQTNTQTIDAGFTKFMIVSNEETSGTGSITYDITFDGTNYQENLESFTEYEINNPGTSLILKQKLNAGASEGIASAYNWGVLLW